MPLKTSSTHTTQPLSLSPSRDITLSLNLSLWRWLAYPRYSTWWVSLRALLQLSCVLTKRLCSQSRCCSNDVAPKYRLNNTSPSALMMITEWIMTIEWSSTMNDREILVCLSKSVCLCVCARASEQTNDDYSLVDLFEFSWDIESSWIRSINIPIDSPSSVDHDYCWNQVDRWIFWFLRIFTWERGISGEFVVDRVSFVSRLRYRYIIIISISFIVCKGDREPYRYRFDLLYDCGLQWLEHHRLVGMSFIQSIALIDIFDIDRSTYDRIDISRLTHSFTLSNSFMPSTHLTISHPNPKMMNLAVLRPRRSSTMLKKYRRRR